MKTLFVASALARSVGMGAAFASVTTDTDGSTYDSGAVVAASKNDTSAPRLRRANPTAWHKTDSMRVVRFGPPEASGNAGCARSPVE
ncbi:MAG: hypothetical protein ABSC95_22200 [Acetobacteraceae bacterium]|jgi:hypothetical protein